MSSIINSTTTSPGGLISTGDSANSLLIQTGDTTAITINSSQQVALTNPLGTASGGTGLSTVGTNGQVLSSNGSTLSWTTPSAGFSGATTTSTGTNLTLTASSTQVQRITATAANLKVILPDATTCTEGGVIFNIINTGYNDFYVVDSTGFSLGTVTSASAAAYFLTDNSTSSGTWATTTLESPFTFSVPDSSAADTINYIVALTDTSGVYVNSTGATVQARAYTLSGSTFTWGTLTTVYTAPSGSGSPNAIFKLTDTTFAVACSAFYGTNRADVAVVACSVSGTTITAGSSINVRTSGGTSLYNQFQYVLRINSTAMLFLTELVNFSTGSYTYYYDTVSFSGTTSTVVSSAAWFSPGTSGNYRNMEFANITNGGATVVWGAHNSGDAKSYVSVMTLSGATVTGYAETMSGTAFSNNSCTYSYSPSANTVWSIPTNGSTKAVRVVTSGTSATITVATVTSAQVTYMGYEGRYLTQSYRAIYIKDYNSISTAQLSYSPNLGYSNVGSTITASCNNIPTASGILAASSSNAIIFVKGWL